MSYATAPAAFAATRPLADVGRWERAAAALCLAQVPEPFFAALAQSQGLTEVPGWTHIFFAPVFAFLAWAIWREPKAAARAMKVTPLLLALLALALVSAFWSIDFGTTLRRALWLALTMTFGLYLAWRYNWKELLEIIAGAFAVLIAGSFAVSLLTPAIGVMATEHPGAWCGLWTHKNMLGGYMALGAPICIAAAIISPERRKLWIAVTLGAIALVLLSTSKTALLATMIGIAFVAAGLLVRRGPMQALGVCAAVAALAAVGLAAFVFAPETLVQLIGRDLTLTGRTDIWAAAEPAVNARPWLGYGYYSFWQVANGPAYWVRQAVGWNVPSAHSGWLEMALGLGRIGVVLFALQLIATAARAVKALANPIAGLAAPAIVAICILYTFSESHVLQANDLFWAIYVAAAARLALDARDARRA